MFNKYENVKKRKSVITAGIVFSTFFLMKAASQM